MSILASLPVKALIKTAIGYISDLVEKIAPDELTENETKNVQKYVGTFYGLLKNAGPDWVAATETDFDDLALKEAFEVCENAAVKFELELDPQLL